MYLAKTSEKVNKINQKFNLIIIIILLLLLLVELYYF